MRIEKRIMRNFHIRSTCLPPYVGRKGTTRIDIYKLIADLGYNYGAEIGVFEGQNALSMFKHIPGLALLCVDPYTPYRARKLKLLEEVQAKAHECLKGYNATFIKKPSLVACDDVEDRTLDFVYIDGLHDFDNVMMDIIKWSQKVKRRGIVAGHDYYTSSYNKVASAVNAYANSHNVHLHLTREWKEISWFWVNA